MGERTAAKFGGAGHQIGVRRGANADHEDARAASHRRDGFEQLLFVTDIAIGQEYDLTEIIGAAARIVVGQCCPHRRHHFRAASGLQRIYE